MENGKNITVKHYNDIVLEKPKKIFRNDALSLVLNISVSYMVCPCSCLRNSYGVLEERKSNCFASPPVFPRTCPMRFLYVSEIEIIPCWAKILVLTGSWICHSSVPYYCAQITAYRDAFRKWIHRLKLCISSHGEFFDGMK